ncbi:hypothetical protein DS2_03020 [Catenovulum agarivorans DS-2]|uniref:HDOD domain-containing protein n=1 Tax=Catenovulum agarivorans DS-2 TaxID=1328313 RepID=W7QIS9_9ALTE|nr:HDOD domain-containing protein [Catenovulum agarivorans]EWH11761.1 hypothetical protein DS2_03020 [Catenovulum agarivorans DS-2]
MANKIYTARQPIFNRKQNVVAYELLFRDGPDNIFPQNVDATQATSRLLVRTHFSQGIERITNNKPALINFSETCLLKELPLLLPKNKIVIEVLECVEPTGQILAMFKKLYHAGYHIALDDFIYDAQWQPFFKYVKLVKFDLQHTGIQAAQTHMDEIRRHRKDCRFLAEKVEDHQMFEQAEAAGFNFFQGYFFCKPEMYASSEIESNKRILIALYKELMREELNFNKITQYFEQDLNLSFKLLRFINSGLLPITQKMQSIRKAIVYLGENEMRRLIALLTTSVLSYDKPRELIQVATIRARFCELMMHKNTPSLREHAFLAGLFSLLDAILDQPLEQILHTLPLSEEIIEALTTQHQTPIKIALSTIQLFEQGSWHLTTMEAMKLKFSYEDICGFYQQAVDWAHNFESC